MSWKKREKESQKNMNIEHEVQIHRLVHLVVLCLIIVGNLGFPEHVIALSTYIICMRRISANQNQETDVTVTIHNTTRRCVDHIHPSSIACDKAK